MIKNRPLKKSFAGFVLGIFSVLWTGATIDQTDDATFAFFYLVVISEVDDVYAAHRFSHESYVPQ